MPIKSSSFIDWEYVKQNVGGEANTGEVITTESTVVLAGPSRIEYLKAEGEQGNVDLYPIGRIAAFDYREQKPNQPAFELGSRRAYYISGKPIFNGDLRGFMLYKSSLLAMAYKYYRENREKSNNEYINTVVGDYADPDNLKIKPGYPTPGSDPTDEGKDREFWGALASELFTVPIGLCVIIRSNRNRSYGAIYLEDVMFNSHMITMAAHDVLMMEATAFDSTMCLPVKLSTAD